MEINKKISTNSCLYIMQTNYKISFPKYPPLVVENNWLYGMWMMGNSYKGSGFYGSYPATYLKRIMGLFPEEENILHLFSGNLKSHEVIGDTFDINSELKPDICGDAENLSGHCKKKYNLIIADPPYTNEDAMCYGFPLVGRNKVVKECHKVLHSGGFLVWLDQVFPMYRKIDWELIGTIGVIISTNHRVRTVFIWRKK